MAKKILVLLLVGILPVAGLAGSWIVSSSAFAQQPAAREDPRTRDFLRALRSEDWSVRGKAAWSLGVLKSASAVEPLIKILATDDSVEVRKWAAWALGTIGDGRAVDALIAALKNGDEEVRQNAAAALGKIGDLRAVPALCDIALRERGDVVRQEAVNALVAMDKPDTVEILAAAFSDGEPFVRQNAAFTLGELKSAAGLTVLAGAAQRDMDAKVRKAALAALGKMQDERVVPPLLAALKDKEREVRATAVQLLRNMPDRASDPRVVEALLAATHDEYWVVRAGAVAALARVDDPRALDRLTAACGDEDISVRQAAVEALSGRKDTRAADAVLAVALRDQSDLVRQSALGGIQNFAGPRLVEQLIAAMDDPDENVRLNAVDLLGEMPDSSSVMVLSAAALADESANVRKRATLALELADRGGALKHFTAALKDENVKTRSNAVECLGVIRNPAAAKVLVSALVDKDPQIRAKAAGALGGAGTFETIPPLIDALKDEAEPVRLCAAEALRAITGEDFGENRDDWEQWWKATRKKASK